MLPFKKSRKMRDRCAPLWNILTEYSTNSTIHGVPYLTEKKFSLAERILWLIILLVSVVICSVFIFHIIEKWNRSPVIVTYASRTTSILDIPFPAVTVCPGIAVRRDLLNITELRESLTDGKLSELELSAEELSNLKEMLFTVCPNKESLWATIDAPERDFVEADLMLELSMIAPPMNETILGCSRGRGWMRNCNRDFQIIFTGNGICYTYNALSPADFYRDDVIYSTDSRKKNPIPPTTWSLENGYNHSAEGRAYPEVILGGPFGNAFKVVLNIHKDNLIFDCNIQGFKVFLHGPSEVASSSADFIKVPLSTDVHVSVSPKMIVTSDELIDYSPSLRNCYYNTERYLVLFKVYTEKNCLLECQTNYTMRVCGCVPFHVPRFKGTSACSVRQIKCFKRAMTELLEVSSLNQVCDCKPACTSLAFDTKTRFSPSDSIKHMYRELKINSTESYLPSIVTILYKETEFIPLTRSELFGKIDLIASCGGILGLFLGISLISFVEFFYFCAIRPFFHQIEEDGIN